MFGDDTTMFNQYVKGRTKLIFPWSLSIVDCFFLGSAFREVSKDDDSDFARISDNGKQIERVLVGSAYDLYAIDSNAYGAEVVLLHERSGSLCYWDIHERFVIAAGTEEFLKLARPYPAHIERHRYIEAMLYFEDLKEPENPEFIYDELEKL